MIFLDTLNSPVSHYCCCKQSFMCKATIIGNWLNSFFFSFRKEHFNDFSVKQLRVYYYTTSISQQCTSTQLTCSDDHLAAPVMNSGFKREIREGEQVAWCAEGRRKQNTVPPLPMLHVPTVGHRAWVSESKDLPFSSRW